MMKQEMIERFQQFIGSHLTQEDDDVMNQVEATMAYIDPEKSTLRAYDNPVYQTLMRVDEAHEDMENGTLQESEWPRIVADYRRLLAAYRNASWLAGYTAAAVADSSR